MNLLVYAPDDVASGQQMLVDIYAGGWGARPSLDGIEGVTPMAAGGATRSLPADDRPGVQRSAGRFWICARHRRRVSTAGRCLFRTWRFTAPGRAMLRNYA